MRWMGRRVVHQRLSVGNRYISATSSPPNLQASRTVIIEGLAKAFRPTAHLLKHIKGSAVERLTYEPDHDRTTLSFINPKSASSIYDRIKTGDLRIKSGLEGPVSLRMGEPTPLSSKLVAGIGLLNANRAISLSFEQDRVDVVTTKKKIRVDAAKVGKFSRLQYERRRGRDIFTLYFYSIESAMKAQQLWAQDPAYANAGIHYAIHEACDTLVYDRILVSNLPEQMGMSGVISLLQPELGQFCSIMKFGEGSFAITFFTHEAASQYLDAASTRYQREPGLKNLKVVANGCAAHNNGKLNRALSASQLGATRTVVLAGVVNYRVFPQTRILEDFQAFGNPYNVSCLTQTGHIHITFSGLGHACRAIYEIESKTNLTERFSDYAQAGLSITFGPEPDATAIPPLTELEPLHLKKIERKFA